MINLQDKSPEELQKIIADAQLYLETLQRSKYKQVIAQIKELAASIGVKVEIHEDGRKTSKVGNVVQPRYRNPDNHYETWTGRGLPPKWLRSKIEEGHDKSEFLI